MSAPTADADFAAAQRALDRYYVLERELGRGGMGVVYLGRDVRLERLVAIKVLPPHLAGDADLRERFLREARTAAKLSHPNIVPVFRADESEGHAFFVMEYVDGESLAERVRARGALPPAEVVVYLREVAWALAYAHLRGVVHRDVKPENIMIERAPNRSHWDPSGIAGRALVTDFGIARVEQAPALTRDGHILGSVFYMSPEQVNGEALDGRSDLYALGVVGYYALSGGRLPFEGEMAAPILLAHATRPPPPLASVAPGVPPEVAAVIERCLAKAPAARYPTGEALADALGDALGRATAAAEVRAASSGAGDFALLSDAQAAAVWRRAAQLQAEAARRLEERARPPSPSSGTGAPAAAGADGLRLRDVEAAAAEAGISRQFVALAVAEMTAAARGGAQAAPPKELAQWQDVVATILLGSTGRSVAASRTVPAAPRRVLQAVGRVLRAPPFSLSLRDAPGRHPLDGGVLVFDLPELGGTRQSYPWTYTRYGVRARQLQVTLRPLPHDPNACEVQLHVDIRQGLRANVIATSALTGFFTGGGGAAGLFVAVEKFALAGAALGLPALGAAVVAGGVSLAVLRASYRREIRKTVAEMESALAAVMASIRTDEIFE